jgi:hypothetical protein
MSRAGRNPSGRNSAVARIEALRRFRAVSPRNVSIEGEVDALLRDAKKVAKAIKAVDESWRVALPADIAPRVRAEKLSRGTLTLVATDAAVKYKLERWLREGGLQSVQAIAKSVKRITVNL